MNAAMATLAGGPVSIGCGGGEDHAKATDETTGTTSAALLGPYNWKSVAVCGPTSPRRPRTGVAWPAD